MYSGQIVISFMSGKIWDLAKELPHGRFFFLGQSSPSKRAMSENQFNKQKKSEVAKKTWALVKAQDPGPAHIREPV